MLQLKGQVVAPPIAEQGLLEFPGNHAGDKIRQKTREVQDFDLKYDLARRLAHLRLCALS